MTPPKPIKLVVGFAPDGAVNAGGEVKPGSTERLTRLIASEWIRYAQPINEISMKAD